MGPLELFLVAVIVLGVAIACYGWGAAIAERKGYSRSMGWWAFVFSLPGLLGLYLMPEASARERRTSPSAPPAPHTARPSHGSATATPVFGVGKPARFCTECGAANASGGRFCTECGSSLTGSS